MVIYHLEQCTYSLIYDKTAKLEYFLVDENDDIEAIYATKLNSINYHTKLGFIEYAENKFGIVNLGLQSRVQEGSKVILQMTWSGDKNKQPKFTQDIKLVGRYVILTKKFKNPIFAKTINNKDRLEEMVRKYSNYGMIFRSIVNDLEELNFVEDEIKDLINKFEQLTEKNLKVLFPMKLLAGTPKYLQLLRNLANSGSIEIVTNNKEVFTLIGKYTSLWKLKPIIYHPEYVVDITTIKNQILEKDIQNESFKLEIHQLSGINLIDVNGYNKQLDFYKINYLAIDTIVWHIKLRDLTGIILIDFIKNMSATQQLKLTEKITQLLQDDWRHSKTLGFSNAGIFELIRNK